MSVSGVLFSVGVCVCDLLIFLPSELLYTVRKCHGLHNTTPNDNIRNLSSVFVVVAFGIVVL